jgi:hypothetical protein
MAKSKGEALVHWEKEIYHENTGNIRCVGGNDGNGGFDLDGV